MIEEMKLKYLYLAQDRRWEDWVWELRIGEEWRLKGRVLEEAGGEKAKTPEGPGGEGGVRGGYGLYNIVFIYIVFYCTTSKNR